jgi:hypothetical protein
MRFTRWKSLIKSILLIGIGIGSTLGYLSADQTNALTQVTQIVDQVTTEVVSPQQTAQDPQAQIADKRVADAIEEAVKGAN